jgi:hypothetical protein
LRERIEETIGVPAGKTDKAGRFTLRTVRCLGLCASSTANTASGISFLLKLPDDFQVPSRSLYLLSTVAFRMLTFWPLTVASLFHKAQETLPAPNFFTGAICITSGGTSSL